MNLKKPITDERVMELIKDQLAEVTRKYSFKYHSAEEMLGVLTEEYHEILNAIRDGKGHVTTAVLGELIDLAVVCIRGAKAYVHAGANMKNYVPDPFLEGSIHGLDAKD